MQSLFGIFLCQEMSHHPSRNVQSGNVGSPSTSFPPSCSLSYRIKIIMSWGFYLLNMSWFCPDFLLSYFAWISKVYYLLALFQTVVYTVLRKSFQLLNWSCCSLPQILCGIPITQVTLWAYLSSHVTLTLIIFPVLFLPLTIWLSAFQPDRSFGFLTGIFSLPPWDLYICSFL